MCSRLELNVSGRLILISDVLTVQLCGSGVKIFAMFPTSGPSLECNLKETVLTVIRLISVYFHHILSCQSLSLRRKHCINGIHEYGRLRARVMRT